MAEIKEAVVYGSNKWSKLKPLDLNSPKLKIIEWDNYVRKEYPKKQIVLHHTVSGKGIQGDLKHLEENYSTVSTCVFIDRDGTINQLFSSKYMGYHLAAGNATLDRESIAIEIDNWGGLVKGDGSTKLFGKKSVKTIDGKFYAAYGNVVNCPVTYYPEGFRGYEYFESYTDEQITSVGELLLLWSKRYNIPLTYHEDMWNVSQNALNGTPGVWTHVSYRKPEDKQDCHPQPELIAMLKTISGLV